MGRVDSRKQLPNGNSAAATRPNNTNKMPANKKQLSVTQQRSAKSNYQGQINAQTFHREGSSDRFKAGAEQPSASVSQECAILTQRTKEQALLEMLKRCEVASRPICFETIDVILRKQDADRMVLELTGKPVDEAYRQMKISQLENYLAALESLGKHWKLFADGKYQHRLKSYGVYGRDIGVMIPYRKNDAPFLSSLTLLSSCMKPVSQNNLGKRVEKAGKEYLQHAASLQVHFLEVTALVKNTLRQRLYKQSATAADAEEDILTSVYNWFVPKPVECSIEQTEKLESAILEDKKFMQLLKRELKLLEVCLRIYEQECIQTIIETQKEVQSQNIDVLVSEEHQYSSGRPSSNQNASHIMTTKYVTNQLLDKDGALLAEHQPVRGRAAAATQGSIQIVQKDSNHHVHSIASPHESSNYTKGTVSGSRIPVKTQLMKQTSCGKPQPLFMKNTLSSSGSGGNNQAAAQLRASTNFTSTQNVSANRGIGSQGSSDLLQNSGIGMMRHGLEHKKATSPVLFEGKFSMDSHQNGVFSASKVLHKSALSKGQREGKENQFGSSERFISPLLHKHLNFKSKHNEIKSQEGQFLSNHNVTSPFASHNHSLSKGFRTNERQKEVINVQINLSEHRPNSEFMRQSREYAQAASPTELTSRMTSQRSSPSAAAAAAIDSASNPALASKFAYGQAHSRKQTEFETVVSPKAGFRDIAERKMSGESLGRSGKLLNSASPGTSEMDENEANVFNKAHGVPLLNMSNFSKSTAQLGRTGESVKQQQQRTQTGRFMISEDPSSSSQVLTPRQHSLSTSTNIGLSVKKTIEMEKRKRQIMACNKDSMQRHLEMLNRVQQQILR